MKLIPALLFVSLSSWASDTVYTSGGYIPKVGEASFTIQDWSPGEALNGKKVTLSLNKNLCQLDRFARPTSCTYMAIWDLKATLVLQEDEPFVGTRFKLEGNLPFRYDLVVLPKHIKVLEYNDNTMRIESVYFLTN